jgi:hypothetical protein
MNFPETATYVIDFSPGGTGGIGPLTACVISMAVVEQEICMWHQSQNKGSKYVVNYGDGANNEEII